jgi:hypothetical protein
VRILYLGPPDFAPLSMLRDYATAGDAEIVLVHPRAGGRLREVWPSVPSVRWVHALSAGVATLEQARALQAEAVITRGFPTHGFPDHHASPPHRRARTLCHGILSQFLIIGHYWALPPQHDPGEPLWNQYALSPFNFG